MNRQLTISLRSVLLGVVAALALLCSYLLGGGAGGGASAGQPAAYAAYPAPAQAASAAAAVGAMRMTGVGRVSVVPDQLTFSLSVSDKETELEPALADASATMKSVLAALRDHGVRTGDVQTTGLQMHPVYDYHSYAPPTLTGYRVTQRASVTVPNLAQGGKAISAAIATGGNGVRASNIRLGVADPGSAIAKARKAAVEDATAKAQEYAEATGQTLGQVVSVREGRSKRSVRPTDGLQRGSYDMAAMAAMPRALPIRAGKNDLSVRVSVVWQFAD